KAITTDLWPHHGKGRTLIIAGDTQPPAVHALAHAMNALLGNAGQTVFYIKPPLPEPGPSWWTLDPRDEGPLDSVDALGQLVADIEVDRVDTLLVLGGNPAYTAPADVPLTSTLEDRLRRPREEWLAVHFGPYFDETARLCHWHVPESHFLES